MIFIAPKIHKGNLKLIVKVNKIQHVISIFVDNL